jgi:uncharacterized protein involved in exopolysaccharide biosynthesis
MTTPGWKSWMLIATLVGAGAGLMAAARIPPLYKSEALILVEPQQVPEAYVKSTVSTPLGERLRTISNQIMSRTRLQRIIQEFDLYPEERQHGIMEDVVQNMRKNIDIQPQGGDSFRVAFVGTEPKTVMRVTERLVSLVMDESLQDREQLAEGTNQFLQSQLEDARLRLIELINKRQQLRAAGQGGSAEAEMLAIDYEVEQAKYKDLLRKKEESKIATDLERLQIGERFKVLEPARVPESRFSPDRRMYAGAGAGAGLTAGMLLYLVIPWKRMRRKPQQEAIPAEA